MQLLYHPVSAILASAEEERQASIYLLFNCAMPLLPLLLYQLMGHLVMKL